MYYLELGPPIPLGDHKGELDYSQMLQMFKSMRNNTPLQEILGMFFPMNHMIIHFLNDSIWAIHQKDCGDHTAEERHDAMLLAGQIGFLYIKNELKIKLPYKNQEITNMEAIPLGRKIVGSMFTHRFMTGGISITI